MFLETIIELLIIWMSVFLAFRFLQGTRGGGVIRGLVVLLAPLWLLQVLADMTGQFQRIDFFAEQFFDLCRINAHYYFPTRASASSHPS